MVVLAGGELFTGNTAFLTVALAEGKATPAQVRAHRARRARGALARRDSSATG